MLSGLSPTPPGGRIVTSFFTPLLKPMVPNARHRAYIRRRASEGLVPASDLHHEASSLSLRPVVTLPWLRHASTALSADAAAEFSPPCPTVLLTSFPQPPPAPVPAHTHTPVPTALLYADDIAVLWPASPPFPPLVAVPSLLVV
jgi:hypothetical protein